VEPSASEATSNLMPQTTDTTPTTSSIASGVMCTGKAGSNGEVCWCGGDCYACQLLSGESHASGAASCTVCKNSMVLLDHVCITPGHCIAAGGIITGRGKFGRSCLHATESTDNPGGGPVQITEPADPPTSVPPSLVCTGKRNSKGGPCWCGGACHMCSLDSVTREVGRCFQCKKAQYLFDFTCIDVGACKAAAGSPTGIGTFGRVCKVASAAASISTDGPDSTDAPIIPSTPGRYTCTRKKDDCHKCTADGQACAICYHQTYLHDGKCRTSCPATDLPMGSGNFNRRCIGELSASTAPTSTSPTKTSQVATTASRSLAGSTTTPTAAGTAAAAVPTLPSTSSSTRTSSPKPICDLATQWQCNNGVQCIKKEYYCDGWSVESNSVSRPLPTQMHALTHPPLSYFRQRASIMLWHRAPA
jgi:hypothetical protein